MEAGREREREQSWVEGKMGRGEGERGEGEGRTVDGSGDGRGERADRVVDGIRDGIQHKLVCCMMQCIVRKCIH